ncbi:hypothetical protein [Rhodanobacter sp. C05]|uniref:hypothetical protein n=1 Tax=Rhodanobacter sp. C05 TaxID=1945855 RepID=UPI000985E0EF|nr:hypothetical protein [Rhodanobacter sp. C05]OOG39149.1 hypothetical protein B0E51_11300 [Rhodanobacter sp. C05]
MIKLNAAFPARLLARMSIIGAILVLAGCAHPVSVRADVNYPSDQTVDTSVGYFISDANRKLEVTTPAGGGDKMRYFPYRDMEPAILNTLGSVFRKVYSVPEAGRAAYISDHHLTFVFEPILTTNSSGNSAIFWPASDFDLTIKVTALNASGQTVWNRDFTGHGHVEKSRSLIDVPPAKEAAAEAFGKLRKALMEDPQFQGSAIH